MLPEARTVEVQGLRVGYRRAGAGPPLLLLHGGFSDSREWRPQLESLRDGWDVIAMDCPGCGASADPPGGYGLREYADTVAGFLAALAIEEAHVGGVSFGSVCALAVVRHHASRVRSLILASAYAGWAGSLSPAELERRIEWLEAALSRPTDEWGADFLASAYSENAPPALVDQAMDLLREARPDGFGPVARAFAGADLRDVLPRIAVPTLLIAGDRDQRSPLEVARDLHAQIAGSQLVVIPNAGHAVNGEAPEKFDAAVRRFLSRL